MITKNQTRSLYFIDRDTDINVLVDKILRVKKSEALVFLERQKNRLQEKDAGTYFTLEDILKTKEGELENMQRFFRGAVVPYYARQKHNIWTEKIDSSYLDDATNDIKRSVGFMKYDHTGHQTDEVNSMSTFEKVKDLNEWLKAVEEVCFDDNVYIFPNSKHFKALCHQKGKDIAQRQIIKELHEKIKNKFKNREIID